MPLSRRARLGLFLERFAVLRPALLKFSHVGPDGTRHYVNRLSWTLTT